MNQEIVVKRVGKDGKRTIELASYNIKDNNTNILTRIRPYISAQLIIQDSIITSLVLSVTNPDIRFAKNLVGNIFEVSLGYSNIKDGKFLNKIFLVFSGLVLQPPYFTEDGQGTDQTLHIPLAMGALPMVEQNKDLFISYTAGVDKIKDFLQKAFVDNQYSSIKKIEAYSPEVENQYFKSSGVINLAENGFTQVQRFLEQTEGIYIFSNNVDTLYYSTLVDMMSENYNKQSKVQNNAGVVYNRPTREKANNVKTFLKTKFAVIGLDNSLNLDLAFVLPNLLGRRYCIIENIGTNIEIYSSMVRKKGEQKNTHSAYYIQRQEIFFSTFGDSDHKITLIADPSDNSINEKYAQIKEE